MKNFFTTDITNALIGGLLIGSSAVLMMLFNGRVAGISGILYQASHLKLESLWHLAFIFGLFIGAGFFFEFNQVNYPRVTATWPYALIGGFIVGFGTRLGGGCTSGHGVCGISRFSPRSIVATLVFMSTGILTVTIMNFI